MYEVKPEGKRFVVADGERFYRDPRTGKPESYAHSGAARKAAETLNARSGQ